MARVRLTKAGAEMLAQAATGSKLIFTRGALGDALVNGKLPDMTLTERDELTQLLHEKMTLSITNMTTVGNNARVVMHVSNRWLTEGFKIAEAGLYARLDVTGSSETLYAYVYFGEDADYLEPLAEGVVREYDFIMNSTVGNAESVDAVVVTDSMSDYVLPAATRSQLGGVIVGDGLSINNGVLSATATGGTAYTLPTASATQKGGIRPGAGLTMSGETLNCTVTNYSLPTATSSRLGGIKAGSGVSVDSSGKLDVTLSGGSNYVLPAASSSQLGGVKVAQNGGLTVASDGSVSLLTASSSVKGGIKLSSQFYTNDSELHITFPSATRNGGVRVGAGSGLTVGGFGSLSVVPATSSQLGGVIVGDGLSVDAYGKLDVTLSGGSDYSLPAATTSKLGGIKAGNGVSVDAEGLLSFRTNNTLLADKRSYMNNATLVAHDAEASGASAKNNSALTFQGRTKFAKLENGENEWVTFNTGADFQSSLKASKIYAEGATIFSNMYDVARDPTHLRGNFIFDGDASRPSQVTFTTSPVWKMQDNQNLALHWRLQVESTCDFSSKNGGTFTLWMPINMKEDATVGGGASIHGGVTIDGAAALKGNVVASGRTSLTGAVIVSGNTSLTGDVHVTGDLTMVGQASLNHGATIDGGATLGGTVKIKDTGGVFVLPTIVAGSNSKPTAVGAMWVEVNLDDKTKQSLKVKLNDSIVELGSV